MLYVYYGEDIDTARRKVQKTVVAMLGKSPDALHFRITTDSLIEYDIDELTLSQGLFKSEYIVVLDTLFQTKEGEVFVLENLQKLKEAPHPFLLLEGKLLAVTRKKLEKYAEKVNEFTLTEKKVKEYNIFALSDALGARDVRRLWTLFREAKERGTKDEEIHGILFWMMKSLVIVSKTTQASDAGMKPYTFQKAKANLHNFTTQRDVEKKCATLTLLPQRARREGVTLEIFLEQFILTL